MELSVFPLLLFEIVLDLRILADGFDPDQAAFLAFVSLTGENDLPVPGLESEPEVTGLCTFEDFEHGAIGLVGLSF